MASFEQGVDNIANSILQVRSNQPKSRITSPPLSGPDSGVVPPNVPGVIKANDLRSQVCVNLPSFLQRLQYKTYLGAASTSIGGTTNYSYTLSDTVPQGRYWVLEYASVTILGGSATAVNFVGMWAIPPGRLPAPNSAAYQADLTGFFAGQSAAHNNGPPISLAIRVDDGFGGTTPLQGGYAVNAELPMVRDRKLLIPAGWTLIAYGGVNGNGQGGSLGEQFGLRIAFSEFLMEEDTDVQ